MNVITLALRERYPAPAWALFFEVSNATGWHGKGFADALAMSLYPSRGIDLHGFEVKTDRSDWLRELGKPAKAENVAAYCDFWHLVAGDKDVAKVEEIPAKWGLLIMHGKSLRQAKAAERLEPQPLDRRFLAAVLRRANEAVSAKWSKDKEVEAAFERGRRQGIDDVGHDLNVHKREREALQRNVEEFERVSGLRIDTWNGGQLGEAVRILRHLQHRDTVQRLGECATLLEKHARELREQAQALKTAPAPKPEELSKFSRPIHVEGKPISETIVEDRR